MSRTPSFYTTPRISANVVGLEFKRTDISLCWRATVKTKGGEATYSIVKSQGKWQASRTGFRRGFRLMELGKHADLSDAFIACEHDHLEGD